MSIKQELQDINNKLDKLKRRLDKAELAHDQVNIVKLKWEIDKLSKQKAAVTAQKDRQAGSEASKLQAMAYKRAITKAEQADMGKLKKSVRGLVVVHPMTALGKEMGLKEMTGFAHKEF